MNAIFTLGLLPIALGSAACFISRPSVASGTRALAAAADLARRVVRNLSEDLALGEGVG
jgi:hypothetical protein